MSKIKYIIGITTLFFVTNSSFAQSQKLARQNTEAADKLYSKFITIQGNGQVSTTHSSTTEGQTAQEKTFSMYPNDYYSLKPTVSRAHINDENVISLPYSDYFTSTMSPLEIKRNADIAYAMGINNVVSPLFSPALNMYSARCNFLLQQGSPIVSYAVYMENIPENGTILPHQLPVMMRGTDFDIVTKDELEGMFSEAGELILPHVMTYRQIETAYEPKASAEAKERIKELKVFLDDVNPDVDFPSNYQLVFSHRRTKTEDIYFIANISQTQYNTEFTFDSEGTSTELWDAMTTERYVLSTDYKDGMTSALLSLQAGQSFFIIVRHYGDASNKIQTLPHAYCELPFNISNAKQASVATTTPTKPTITVKPAKPVVTVQPTKPVVKETPTTVTTPTKPEATTPGVVPPKKQKVPTGFMKPWAIEFNMKLMHKPTATTTIQNRAFYIMRPPQLTDWTSNSDTRIQFYSGVAIYRNTFNTNDVPTEGSAPGNRYTLQIEEAHDTVTVIVNGVEVRQLTAAPYELDITQFVCQGSNAIELHVKNSPINRYVGDLTLPEELRIHKTIPASITLNTPLQPSGIVGLVKVIRK